MIHSWKKRFATLAFERGGLIALVALVLYVWLAPPHIVDGDNAEFATLGSIGGVAHPSGYPLYLIWLRATSWLPAEGPAHAAAVATAILAAAQVLVLHAACRVWGARPAAASFAVAILATGPAVLRIQTEAEVFALNGLIAACILWLAAIEGPLRGTSRALGLAFVAGLGLANHLTCVLLAPIGLLGFVRGVRESRHPASVTVGLGLVGLVAGLTPYLYLMATRESALSWTRIEDLSHLVHHFLRLDYGGAGQFSPRGKDVATMTSWVAMVQTIGRAWLWLPLGVGVGTLVWRVGKPRGAETRWGWAMLAACVLVAGPGLASRFNVIPEGIGLYVVRRFHILPALLLAPAVAVGLDALGSWGQRRFDHGALRSPAIGGTLAVLTLLATAGVSLPHLLQAHSPAVEFGLRNTLRSLPPNAVLIAQTDIMYFGMGYLQAALGERPDVTVVAWPQIPSLRYRERLAERSGIKVEPGDQRVTTVDVARQVLAMGRPLFIDPYNSNIAKALPTYPYGVLFRVVQAGESIPPIEEVYALNRSLFDKFDLAYSFPGFEDEYATDIHQQYARLWHILAQGLGLAGRLEEQAIANAFAEALAPKGE